MKNSMVTIDLKSYEMEKLVSFFDRVYAVLVEDGNDIKYGDYYSKCKKNGLVKVLKSLGLYQTSGRAENKKVMIHPKLKFIFDTTIADNEIVAKTIIDAVNGKYLDLEKMIVQDFSEFYQLDDNDTIMQDNSYGTYIVYSPKMNLFKIGKTKDLGKRIAKLQYEYDNGLYLIGFLDKDIESFLHKELKEYRKVGEWFEIDMQTALDYCSMYNFKHSIKNEIDLVNYLSK